MHQNCACSMDFGCNGQCRSRTGCPIAGKTTFSESGDVRGDTAWRHCVKMGHGLLSHPLPATPRTPCHPSRRGTRRRILKRYAIGRRVPDIRFCIYVHIYIHTYVYVYVRLWRMYLSGTRWDWIKSTSRRVIWLKLWSWVIYIYCWNENGVAFWKQILMLCRSVLFLIFS